MDGLHLFVWFFILSSRSILSYAVPEFDAYEAQENDFVDPLDMGMVVRTKSNSGKPKMDGKLSDLNSMANDEKGSTCDEKPSEMEKPNKNVELKVTEKIFVDTSAVQREKVQQNVHLFVHRLINILCVALNINDDRAEPVWMPHVIANDRVIHFSAVLQITETNYHFLKNFSSNSKHQKTATSFIPQHVIDDVFSHLFVSASPSLDSAYRSSVFSMDFLERFVPDEDVLLKMGTVFMLSMLLSLFLLNLISLGKLFTILLMVSTIWHWCHMYKRALTRKHVTLMSNTGKAHQPFGNVPKECFPDTMTWVQFFKHTLSSQDKCTEYYNALMVDPLWEVTPTMAFAETIINLIFLPLETLGGHVGKFFKALLAETSIISSVFVLPYVSASILIVIVLFLMMWFRYEVKLPIFFSISPLTSQPQQHESIHQTLETLAEVKKLQLQLEKTISSLVQDNRYLNITTDTKNSNELDNSSATPLVSVKHHKYHKMCLQHEIIPAVPLESKVLEVTEDTETHTNDENETVVKEKGDFDKENCAG